MLKRFSLIALLIIISTSVFAQYDHPRKKQAEAGSRDGRWEGSVILAFQTGLDRTYEGGSELKVDSTLGWGFSFAWNWTERLNLAYRFMSTSPKYSALFVQEEDPDTPGELNYKMTKNTHQFNVTYNFSSKAFTPFVVAGVGWTKLDSNVPNSPPALGCWWDPWWGYICFADWETYKTSEFTYNLGAGVRWDINTMVFTKASYVREFLSAENGSINLDTAVIELGMMF